MSFIDRIVQFPGRVKLTPVSGQTNVYDMVRQEGDVYTDGTLLNANNLNTQTQLDGSVEGLFTAAGMTSGTYQNSVSDTIAFLLENLKPAIHSSGSWRYIVFGKLIIAWVSYSASLTLQTAIGSMYTQSSVSNITFPSGLNMTTPIYANINVIPSGYPILTAIRSLSPSGATYQAMSTSARSSAAYTINCLVVGYTE